MKNPSASDSRNDVVTNNDKHDIEKLNQMSTKENSKTPQHDVYELANQILLLNRFHLAHEEKIKKIYA